MQSVSPLSSDGAALSAAAKKIPAPKKTGDRNKDEQLERQRDALVWIVDRLTKRPGEIIPLQSFLITRDLEKETAVVQNGSWTGNYRQLDRVPKDFMTKFLLRRAAETKVAQFTPEYVKQLELADTMNIPTLFFMELQLPGSLTMPDAMQDESIAMQVFLKRARDVGGRLASMSAKGGLQHGKLDFRKGGAYAIKFEENIAMEISHIQGDVAPVPKHCPISPEFVLTDNHFDFKALVQLHPSSHNLASFFKPDANFMKGIYTPGKKWCILRDMANTIAEAEEQRRANGSTSASEALMAAGVLKDASKERKQAQLVKARQVLEDRKEKRKQCRTIKLG